MPRIRMRCWPLVFTVCSCLVCGCSLGPVNTPAFSIDSGIRRIDPNGGLLTIEETCAADPNTGQTRLRHTIRLKGARVKPNRDDARAVRMKYRALDFDLSSRVAVQVRVGDAHRYWALMDTGCPFGLYVNDVVVRDCDLAVFPLGESAHTGCSLGICEVPTLQIGQITVTNPHCWYTQRHWQLRVLGQPLYRKSTVLVGLRLLRAFPYVLFDNVRREAVIGLRDPFEPNDRNEWVSLPFVLQEADGEPRMMVDVFLGQHPTRVAFDTGGARPGLVLRDNVWQDLGGDRGTAGRFVSYQFGWLPCRRVVVPELRVGPLILKDRKAIVLGPNSPYAAGSDGILSLDYFRKTSVVLDFRRDMIWIRKF